MKHAIKQSKQELAKSTIDKVSKQNPQHKKPNTPSLKITPKKQQQEKKPKHFKHLDTRGSEIIALKWSVATRD